MFSSSSGDQYHVAPSRRTDEEEESDDEVGRHDPHTKASHDRPAGTRESAPREEEASAPQEGPEASAPQPWRAAKRWRAADE